MFLRRDYDVGVNFHRAGWGAWLLNTVLTGGWRMLPVHGRLPFPSSVILFSTAVNVMEPNSCLPGTKQVLLVEVKKILHGICI